MSSIFCKIYLTIFSMKNLFSLRLRELLNENGISKRECAANIGVSAMSVSDWTNGKVQPVAENIYALARYLGVSSDYLLGLEDEFGSNVFIAGELNDEEKTLIKDFRKLDKTGKAAAFGALNGLAALR